jgi:hypothetical protein
LGQSRRIAPMANRALTPDQVTASKSIEASGYRAGKRPGKERSAYRPARIPALPIPSPGEAGGVSLAVRGKLTAPANGRMGGLFLGRGGTVPDRVEGRWPEAVPGAGP